MRWSSAAAYSDCTGTARLAADASLLCVIPETSSSLMSQASALHSLIAGEVLLSDTNAFLDSLKADPELSRMAQHATDRAQLIAYEWLMRDAMDSPNRTAHFLCEHALRRNGEHAELLSMELTQAQIGEITAQTSINVNRVLRVYEREKIFVPIGGRVYLPDWPELCRLGRFDPRYLDWKAETS